MAASIHSDDASQVLDDLPVGVIVVDAELKMESANRKGRDIVAEGEGLSAEGDTLLASPAHDEALRALVAAALAAPEARSSVLRIQRPEGRSPLELSASPISAATNGGGGPRVALFVVDNREGVPLSPDILTARYRLTPAEARLASLLAAGTGLRAASGRLGVSLNTVRSQLRSIFAKTETRRQSELIHRLLTSSVRFQTPGS